MEITSRTKTKGRSGIHAHIRSEERECLRLRKDLMEQHWTQREVKCLLQIQQFIMKKHQGEKLTLEDPSLHSYSLQRKRHF